VHEALRAPESIKPCYSVHFLGFENKTPQNSIAAFYNTSNRCPLMSPPNLCYVNVPTVNKRIAGSLYRKEKATK
jgi:hypothetical protein